MPSRPTRWPRAIGQRSPKPAVARRPVGAPACSARQFVTAVVPSPRWTAPARRRARGTPASAAAASAARRPSTRARGVVGAFPRQPRVPSVTKQSVNVPPMSIPIAYAGMGPRDNSGGRAAGARQHRPPRSSPRRRRPMYVAMGCAHADALARLGAREIGQADLDAGLPPPDPATLRAAYRAETASAFHAWLGFAAALFLFFLGIGAVMEGAYHPERTAWAIVFYGGCVAACAAALGLSRLTRAPTEVVSVVFAAVIAILLSGYARTVGAEAEVHLMAHICLMCGLASILPLG